MRSKRNKYEQKMEEEDDDDDEETKDFVTKNDRDILRYYYYLTQGIDDNYVGSMGTDILENILSIIPIKLRQKFKECLNDLVKEVKREYVLSIKKSVIEFVIGDSLYSLLNQVSFSR